MNVLTWHGAVVRVDGARQRLVQDPVWMTAADGSDFVFDATSPSAAQIALGEVTLAPAGRAGVVRIAGAAGLLTAAPGKRDVVFEPDEGQGWQTFLLLSPDDLADLRHILAHRWRVRPSSQILEKADIRLGTDFALTLGGHAIDLTEALPLASYTRRAVLRNAAYAPPPSFVIRPGNDMAESIELADGTAAYAVSDQFELQPRRSATLPAVSTRDAFMRTPRCSLGITPVASQYVAPPVVTRARDRDLFATWLEGQAAPVIGFVPEAFGIRREQKRYVVLMRGGEGLIFDAEGASGDITALAQAPRVPHGLIERRGRFWASRDALEELPRLDGPLIVFYDHHLDDLWHWLTGALPALDAIMRYAPRGARLLLPGVGRSRPGPEGFNYREMLNLAGFGQVPTVESGADIVWSDDVITPEQCDPAHIPAAQLHDFRTRVLAPFDGPGEPTRRIYIRRSDACSLQAGHEVEQILTQEGFEHVVLEELSQQAQLELFHQAAFVVAAHGPELANLIFAPAGLRVIELMGNAQFHPQAWRLCTRVGHLHAFLGCEVEGEGEEARLVPDTERFCELLRAVELFRL